MSNQDKTLNLMDGIEYLRKKDAVVRALEVAQDLVLKSPGTGEDFLVIESLLKREKEERDEVIGKLEKMVGKGREE